VALGEARRVERLERTMRLRLPTVSERGTRTTGARIADHPSDGSRDARKRDAPTSRPGSTARGRCTRASMRGCAGQQSEKPA
jgi:hypothetical protein